MFWSKNKNTYKSIVNWDFDVNFLKTSFLQKGKSCCTQVFPVKNFGKLWFSYSLKPNIKDENGKNSVWIYFNCFTGYEEVRVDLTVKAVCKSDDFLFNLQKTNEKQEFIFTTSGSQGIKLIGHENLHCFKNEAFYLSFESSITVKSEICNNCFLSKKLFNSGNKDLKIIIGEKEIMVHKTILETFSPIFKKMIEAQNGGEENVFEISDCDFETVENGINFCYGFSEWISSDIDELIETLKFSNKYEINDLKEEIEFKLMPKISEENVCKISNAAIEFNAESLNCITCKIC